MTRRELIDLCLTFPGAYEDYPFDDTAGVGVWTVMRHRENKKSFALIFERMGRLCVNLKCDPMQADFWRGVYKDCQPGWHMNKVHWNTICLGGDVPEEELAGMIRDSFVLTKTKKART